MFVICPIQNPIEDGEMYDDIDEAKEQAMNWSVELQGEDVMIYEGIEGNYGYDFKPIKLIRA